MWRQRSAKIVATLGPSSSTFEQIRALFEAGVDVFRLNFSHGTHREHLARFEAIRRVEHETGRQVDRQPPQFVRAARRGRFREREGNADRSRMPGCLLEGAHTASQDARLEAVRLQGERRGPRARCARPEQRQREQGGERNAGVRADGEP